jgi:hypothetical protein
MRERFPLVGYGLWCCNSIAYGLRQARPMFVPINCIRPNANAQTLLTDEVPTATFAANHICEGRSEKSF